MSDVPAPAGPGIPAEARWRVLVTPRWLAWHLFAVAAVAGMAWLGDWQFHRAMSGNTLSWAYTFEWPIFAVLGVIFWVKTVRDELHPPADAGEPAEVVLPAGARRRGTSDADGAGAGSGDEQDDAELAEYNAYLARLTSQARGHGRWHGLR
jgi:hypothetical protein